MAILPLQIRDVHRINSFTNISRILEIGKNTVSIKKTILTRGKESLRSGFLKALVVAFNFSGPWTVLS